MFSKIVSPAARTLATRTLAARILAAIALIASSVACSGTMAAGNQAMQSAESRPNPLISPIDQGVQKSVARTKVAIGVADDGEITR
jgi:hypothetical protein